MIGLIRFFECKLAIVDDKLFFELVNTVPELSFTFNFMDHMVLPVTVLNSHKTFYINIALKLTIGFMNFSMLMCGFKMSFCVFKICFLLSQFFFHGLQIDKITICHSPKGFEGSFQFLAWSLISYVQITPIMCIHFNWSTIDALCDKIP